MGTKLSTSGAKWRVGAKRSGGKRLVGKMTRGGNGLGVKRPRFPAISAYVGEN